MLQEGRGGYKHQQGMEARLAIPGNNETHGWSQKRGSTIEKEGVLFPIVEGERVRVVPRVFDRRLVSRQYE